MTIRLFACTTKVCCGPCPGEFGIQLRKTTCPDSVCQSWGWWIPNFSGAASAEVVYTKGCGGIVTESANIEVWHIIPIGGCESSPETGAWIPAVKTYCVGDPSCEGIDPDPTELTFFDGDGIPIAYYIKSTGGVPGSTTIPHPPCPLTGNLTYSEGGGIGSISSEESTQYIPNWPCEIALDSFPICDSTDKIYRLTNASKEALESAYTGGVVSSVTLEDNGSNSQILTLSNLGPQIGCTETENTWNGVLNFAPTKVIIATPLSTPPVYNISGGCVGYRATVSDGSFCGSTLNVSLYRKADLPCPGLSPNQMTIVIDSADIPVVPTYTPIAIVVGFTGTSTTLTLGLAGINLYALYKDALLEDCDEITGSKWINSIVPSTYEICKVTVTYQNIFIGSMDVVYYVTECGCADSKVTVASIQEFPLTKVTNLPCGEFYPFSISGSGTTSCSDVRYTPYRISDGSACPILPCCGIYAPRVCTAGLSHTINADPLTELMTFSESLDHTITLPPVGGTRNAGATVRWQVTISKAACTLAVYLTGTITITCNATPTFTLPDGNTDSGYVYFDIASLIPSSVKLVLRLKAWSGTGHIDGNCCTGCTGGVTSRSTSIMVDTDTRLLSGDGL